ncbi:MAG: RNA polymerase-binding protein DksA [SAR116 cluster bacterium]|nr:RNA polymerase-binding protein DksA [SAR116 cluster bacterium]|tara:strand:- start:442 stop:921 length:480 start_codon:yes stop_codon:yes gene_type:complete
MNSTTNKKLNIDEKNKTGVLGSRLVIPDDYLPNETETFMNEYQLEFFRKKLLNWKLELLEEATDTKDDLSEEGLQRPDMADRAQVESDASIKLRTRDRERKLINKIDSALRRIDLGTYGYCEETGDPIGIKRLMARPIASLCLDAQERHEKMERVHKDD